MTSSMGGGVRGSDCGALLAEVKEISDQIRNPPASWRPSDPWARLHEHPNRFDPNRWFTVFAHLRMRDGRTLDFVYDLRGNEGRPILYARGVAEPRCPSAEELRKRGISPDHWQSDVVYLKTPEALFEMAVLARVAHRFHLYWHAFADNAEYLVDRARLVQVLDACPEPRAGRVPPPGALDRSRAEVLAAAEPFLLPSIEQRNGQAIVRLLSWQLPGGLSLQFLSVKEGEPVRLLEEKPLCRVMGGPVF